VRSFVDETAVALFGVRGLSGDATGAVLVDGEWRARVWDLGGRWRGPHLRRTANHTVCCTETHSAGLVLVSHGPPGTVEVRDFESDACLWTTRCGAPAKLLAISLTARLGLYVSGNHAEVEVWDLETGKTLRHLRGHRSLVNGAAISADGRWALTGANDGTAKLWDLATGRCVRTLDDGGSGVRAVGFSGDGRRAICGGYGGVSVWTVDLSRCAPARFRISRPQSFGALRERQEEIGTAVRSAKAAFAAGRHLESYEELIAAWRGAEFRPDPDMDALYRTLRGRATIGNLLSIGSETLARDFGFEAFWGVALAISCDGQRFVARSGDGTLKVRDMAGRSLHSL
jgi:WD40 repeat protein